MIINNISICIVFLASLLVVRGYMGLIVRTTLSKNERKKYKDETSFVNRWFLWSTHRFVKDRYSKYEKRTIRHSSIVCVYRMLNAILHILLIITIVVAVCNYYNALPSRIFNYTCWCYIVFLLFSFTLLAIIELVSNRKYHKKRYSR